MVEGPGCTLNGEKIRAKVKKGQKVKEIRKGTLSTSLVSDPKGSQQGSFRIFTGCQFTGVETLGKELFMYFGQKALRVHFGMNGSMRINPSERKDRSGAPPILEIQLTNDVVFFFDSTVDIRLTAECEQKIRCMEDLDVCSPKFSFSRAEDEVRKQSGRMLCDVLLDQAVLPGVGNIIKNEALFDSGLHPAVKVGHLTDDQIHHLVKMTRDFTVLFYKCRKTGSALCKHYKVYKRPNCGQCGEQITVCRLGENSRMTYFCSCCQKENPCQVNVGKLPLRNSLIGWTYGAGTQSNDQVAKKEEEEWTCALCTLINKPAAKSCNACLTSRPDITKVEISEEPSAFTRDLIRFPCNAFTKSEVDLKVNRKAAFGTSTLIFTDLSCKSAPARSNSSVNNVLTSSFGSSIADSSFNKHNFSQRKTSPNYSNSGKKSSEVSDKDKSDLYHQPQKKMKTDHNSFSITKGHSGNHNSTLSEPRVNMTDGTVLLSHGSPCCATHNRPSILRVVKKSGENKGRQFYACSLPRETQCEFFMWADSHFPTCNHAKRCLMRTVLKTGPNNGRNFYVCPLGKNKQCDFFQWAENGPGIKIIPGC
ncbi:endonuclease 8-like 3 isoform X2 [Polyodon spathula]|uniref:endonuclease 8-like 3 isoform X2 n=1 Tax=Polyodon spathula TaxID=7913 RepID=UPI001B7F45CE|nr:endonuclease 8-like 3 isoform X2 [Polyodon spathula]